MRTHFVAGILLAFVSFQSSAIGQDATTADRIAGLCASSRQLRVAEAQTLSRAWLVRVSRVQAACKLTLSHTGKILVTSSGLSPELRENLVCPHGVPAGETKDTAAAVLDLMQDGVPITPDSATDEGKAPQLNSACASYDIVVGLDVRPSLNDRGAILRLLSWKPARS